MDGAQTPTPRWERISHLFQEALELSQDDRAAFLEEAAGDDPDLRERVSSLLLAHDAAREGEDRLGGLVSGLEAGRAASLLRHATWATGGPEPPSRESDPGSSAHGPATDGPLPGEMVGGYRILRRLGRGGMGSVYEAHDPVLDRIVALKFLSSRGGSDARLLEEARAASALDHPGIGTVHEIATDDGGRSFIAMARYPGGTLRDRLRRGPLSVDEAAHIGAAVAEALGAAHARGILHLDVKPENLLFDESGQVKVVDFGISRMVSSEVAAEGTAGTLAYMSPERLKGRSVDGRADIWALGVVLFEMLTGRHPLQGREAPEVSEVVRSGELGALAPVVEHCLASDPEDRPAAGEAVATALRAAVAVAEAPRPARGGSRLPPLPTALIGAAALVILALVMGAVARQSPRLVEARGFAGEAFAPRGQVLVTEFQVGDGLADLAIATREALVVDLQQSGFVRVVARGRVEETLGRMGHTADTPLEGGLALEVAERLGAGAVLQTSVARVGSRYVLAGRALNPRSGEELFSVRTSGGERRLLGAVERLSREVRLRLGEASESLAESRPLPQVTTASLDALRLYALAERAMAEDPTRVVAYLDAALELDPEFAMAHRLAAAAGVNRMRFQDTAHHLGLAWEYRDRLPDRERWLVEAAHASDTRYDPFAAEGLYQRIVARFPDERIAWANLGNTRVSWLADPEGGLAALVRAVELEPETLPTLPGAAQLALILGRLEQADALMAKASGSGFEAMRARWQVSRAFWLADDAGISEACEHLLEAGHPQIPQADPREVCGSILLVQGDRDGALPLLQSVGEEYIRRGSYRNLASVLQSLAVAELMVGDTVAARSHFTRAMELADPGAFGEPDRYIYRTNLQVHAALLGWIDLVEAIGRRYPALSDPDHLLGRGGEHLVRAALALAKGDGDGALLELEAAFPTGVMAMGWRTYDEILRARAFELLGEAELSAGHYRRAADRGWAGFPGLTKDRLMILEALAGLERLSGSGGPVAAEDSRGAGVDSPQDV